MPLPPTTPTPATPTTTTTTPLSGSLRNVPGTPRKTGRRRSNKPQTSEQSRRILCESNLRVTDAEAGNLHGPLLHPVTQPTHQTRNRLHGQVEPVSDRLVTHPPLQIEEVHDAVLGGYGLTEHRTTNTIHQPRNRLRSPVRVRLVELSGWAVDSWRNRLA